MISTDFSYEEYETRRVERHKAEGLRFVPEGTGAKVYCVVCKDASDWNEIHDYIINENEIDGIPNRKIDCTNLCKICDRMASYEMSDAEAEQLKNHPKVDWVEQSSLYNPIVLEQRKYDEEFDRFLHEEVGYEKLSILTNDIFINPYAITSLREYFAMAFERGF